MFFSLYIHIFNFHSLYLTCFAHLPISTWACTWRQGATVLFTQQYDTKHGTTELCIIGHTNKMLPSWSLPFPFYSHISHSRQSAILLHAGSCDTIITKYSWHWHPYGSRQSRISLSTQVMLLVDWLF